MVQGQRVKGALSYACAAVGLAAIWPVFRGDGVSSLIVSGLADTGAQRGIYLVYMLAILTMAVVYAATWRRASLLLTHASWVVPAVSVVASVAAGVLWAGDSLGGAAVACCIAAAVVHALWVVLIIPAWGSIGCRIEDFASWAAVVVASIVISLLPSVTGVLASPVVFGAIVVGEPAVSGVCRWVFFRGGAANARGSFGQTSAEISVSEAGDPMLPTLKRTGLLVVLMLLGSLMRGLLNNGQISTAPSPSSFYTHAVTVLIAVLFVVLLVRRQGPPDGYSSLFIALSTVMLVGLFSVALGDARTGGLVPLSRSIVIAGWTCMGLLLWVTLATKTASSPEAAPVLFCVLYVCVQAVAALLSYLITPSLAQYLGVDLGENLLTCSLATAFVLVLISYAFLYGGKVVPAAAGSQTTTRSQRCERIAARCGLTDRERDVVMMISQGHSVRKLSDTLGLSVNTVQGYSKSAYRKLDVHSRQELIDLIDGEE